MVQRSAQQVLEFWLDEVGPKGWFTADDAVDEEIRRRFGDLVERALAGDLEGAPGPSAVDRQNVLALLILLDQFPRNLFRGQAKAFAGDAQALELSREAIALGLDLATPEPQRMFFYLPFEHSETLEDQNRAVSLFEERLRSWPDSVEHAEKHRELIRKFGRFPHRNAALGRESTPEEIAHLEGGGYAPGAKPK